VCTVLAESAKSSKSNSLFSGINPTCGQEYKPQSPSLNPKKHNYVMRKNP
jgi:hypothetical protein